MISIARAIVPNIGFAQQTEHIAQWQRLCLLLPWILVYCPATDVPHAVATSARRPGLIYCCGVLCRRWCRALPAILWHILLLNMHCPALLRVFTGLLPLVNWAFCCTMWLSRYETAIVVSLPTPAAPLGHCKLSVATMDTNNMPASSDGKVSAWKFTPVAASTCATWLGNQRQMLL